MDLRKDFPRSMRFKLAGYAHLARMIDKCRAVLAGTEGEYIYPCPMDERLLEFAGMTSEQFTAAVKANSTDEGIVKWFELQAKPHAPDELEEWNQKLLARGPSSPESAARFKKIPGRDRSIPHRHHRLVGPARSRRRAGCPETRAGTSASVSERRVFAEVGRVLCLRHHEVRHISTGNGTHLHSFYKFVEHAIAACHRSAG